MNATIEATSSFNRAVTMYTDMLYTGKPSVTAVKSYAVLANALHILMHSVPRQTKIVVSIKTLERGLKAVGLPHSLSRVCSIGTESYCIFSKILSGVFNLALVVSRTNSWLLVDISDNNCLSAADNPQIIDKTAFDGALRESLSASGYEPPTAQFRVEVTKSLLESVSAPAFAGVEWFPCVPCFDGTRIEARFTNLHDATNLSFALDLLGISSVCSW